MSMSETLVKQEGPLTPSRLKVEVDAFSDGEVLGEGEDGENINMDLDELDDSDEAYSPSVSEGHRAGDRPFCEDKTTASPRRLREKKKARYRFTKKTIVDNRRVFPKIPSPRRRGTKGESIIKLRAELSAARRQVELLAEENAALLSVSGTVPSLDAPVSERTATQNPSVDSGTVVAPELCEVLMLVSPVWMARLVDGDARRVEAITTIFDLIRDGLTDKKHLDRLFERLVLTPRSLDTIRP